MTSIKTVANAGILFLISGLLFSCSSLNNLTISVKQPAPVHVPYSIKKVGVINRNTVVDRNKKLDALDKLFSLEGKNLDEHAASKAIEGLFDELLQMNRFDAVKTIEAPEIKTPGMGVFPATLSWDLVDQLCKKHAVDALFFLSFYDTESKINTDVAPVELNGPLGIKIPAVETSVTVNTLIKTGWRIYDPMAEVLRDEFIGVENITSVGKGINPVKAAEAIMGRKEAVLQLSNTMGHNYARRIAPYTTRVNRQYYVRGSSNFKIAKRRAQTGNWDGAAELWEKETTNAKPKIAGRAYYNMAIINEINDDLTTAIDFASKSYVDYKNKEALRYLSILKQRQQQNQVLEHQLNDR